MMILEHSRFEDNQRAMRRSHAAVMDPNATPESAKASLKVHGITRDDLKSNPLFVEMWIDRFPDNAQWVRYMADAIAFVIEASIPWEWRHAVEKTLKYASPAIRSAWEGDPQTAMWRYYTYTDDTTLPGISALSFSDLSANVWRTDVPVYALYEVADRILDNNSKAPASTKAAIGFGLYMHGARCFHRDIPIKDLVENDVTDQARAFLYWGWKTHSFLGMARNKGFPKTAVFPADLLQVLQDNTTICLETLEHTFGSDDAEDDQVAPLLCLTNTPLSLGTALPVALRESFPATQAAVNTAEGLTCATLELYRLVRQILMPAVTPAISLPDQISL
jgi:hypothetical protein